MIVMTPGASEAEVAAVKDRLATTGVHVVVMPGELTTAIGAIGDPAGVAELGLEGMSGVDRVVPISRPYKLASSELYHEGPTILDIAGRSVGGGDTFCLIAGPCTVESREQTLGVARSVKAAGASMLRGGAFKPRTSPFAFKGLGAEALAILGEARAETGLPVVTELLAASHADLIAEHADVVQIGARNMQNYALLEIAGKLGKPTLVKGDDLVVSGDRIHIRTVAGLKRLVVLLRRVDSNWLDTLELDASSHLGVPGLIEVLRKNGVVVANMPGSGVLEARALLGFLPSLARRLLGEDLK